VPSRRAYDLTEKHYPITLKSDSAAGCPAARFHDFAKGKREWADVLALVPDPP